MSYKIIVINLEKRQDRKQKVINTFSNVNFEEYSFYKAIDGKNIDLTLEIKNLFKNNDFANRKGFIGCALSHYYIWLDLLKDKKNDYYVIFEDDFDLSDNFINDFNNSKNYINTCDILFLGYHEFTKNTNKCSNFAINTLNRNNYAGGLFGYIITKQGASKMLDYINKNGIKHGIDYVIKINLDLTLNVTFPQIVISDWVKKHNDGIDSNIQNDYDTFNFNSICDTNNFIFIRGVDQINNDYKFLNTQNINDFIECKNIAGFNTLGFTKSYININNLTKSQWFGENDGIFINLDRKIRVKLICNWCDSKKLCDNWIHMFNNISNIQITYEDINIDYYIIINKPLDQKYIPKKTIIFQMEPWCYNENQTWGVKTWGEWAEPDESKFLHVRTHKKYYNNCTWNINIPNIIDKKFDSLSTICSSKYFDEGHIKRIDFLKFIENKNTLKIDIYGIDNKHNFKNYKGELSNDLKHNGIVPYKYYFMVENNIEYNYISEKLWEPIVSECLCFYWGAPNVSEYLNPLSYVQLDMYDFEKSYNIIKESIENDLWTKRIDIIKAEKYKVLNYYNFFPTIERIIMKDLWKNNLNIFDVIVLIIQKNNELNYKIIPLINTLKDLGINVNIRKYDEDNLYEDLLKMNKSNYLILNDNTELIWPLNKFLNYILYLPENYDVCQLFNNNTNKPFKIINQYNPLYYNVRKYFFETNEGYFISYNGLQKIINNKIICESKDLIYECYENINNFNFYCA
jgi:GR25 family glycosyltransferase involved in LPS biosynthesis